MNASLLANQKLGNMSGWQDRHNAAVTTPRLGAERALVTMLTGWLEYASTYETRNESKVGGDGVLGEAWAEIGRGILQLLNGDCGPRIDCGTIDHIVRDTLRKNEIEGDE